MAAIFEKGLYLGKCISQFMGQSENDNKTPYFALRFQIMARITRENELANTHEGERTVYLYLSDKAMDMAVEVLTFLGYQKESLRFLDPTVENHHSFVGREVDLWCKVETYQGDTKEKWSISTPREQHQAVPIEQSELRRLDAMFGKALKSKPPTKPAVQQEQTRAEPEKKQRPDPSATAPPPDQDIPFAPNRY